MSTHLVFFILVYILDIFLNVQGLPTVILTGNSSVITGDTAMLKAIVIPNINITSVVWQNISDDDVRNISVKLPKFVENQLTSGGTIVLTLKILNVSAEDEVDFRVIVFSNGSSYVSNKHALDVHEDSSNCEPGYYGDHCEFRCTGNCANNAICHSTSGYCPGDCTPGWEGRLCDKECQSGFYGVNCRQTCSGNCQEGQPCGRFRGHCRNGCIEGWSGERCDNSVPQTQTSTSQTPGLEVPSYVLYVALSVSSVIILGAGVIVLVCCVRKRQGKRSSSTNSDKNERGENSKIFSTEHEIYDSIYEEPIEQNNERPPSYHTAEHMYDEMKPDYPVNDYIEITE